jgi:hypothetical protein
MDRERALKHLAEVEQIVALGLKHIADQEFRMSQLDGDDLAHAQDLLKTFKQSRVLHEEHRDQVRRVLGV